MDTLVPQRQNFFTPTEEYYFKTKAQAGDREAFIELLHGYANLIKSACRAVGAYQNRDEDIYQQAIVEFEDLMMRHKADAGLGAYLKKLLPLRLRDYIRNRCYSVRLTSYAIQKFRETQAPEVARWVDGLIMHEFDYVSDFDSPEEYLSITDLKEFVGKAIASLPEKQRSVIARLFFEGCNVQEIAKQDGVTAAAIYKTRKQAFARLAQYPGLSEYFDDVGVDDEREVLDYCESVEEPEETVVSEGLPNRPKTYFEIMLNFSKESLLYLVSSFRSVPSMISKYREAKKAIKPELSPSARNVDRLLFLGSASCGLTAIATVKAKGNTYRLYRPKTLDEHGAIETLIMENAQGICVHLNEESDGTIRPLSSYTDSAIALELNRQKWQRTIQAQGGVEKFQQGFNQFAATEAKHYMPSDAYESLQALGVAIPKNVHPYDQPPADIPEIKHGPADSKPNS